MAINVVRVIVHSPQRKILLVQSLRLARYGTWEFPGGKVEEDECPYDAALRELREETRIRLTKMQLVRVIERPIPHDSRVTVKYHCFRALRPTKQTPGRGDPKEIQRVGWFEVRNLPPLDERAHFLLQHLAVLEAAM